MPQDKDTQLEAMMPMTEAKVQGSDGKNLDHPGSGPSERDITTLGQLSAQNKLSGSKANRLLPDSKRLLHSEASMSKPCKVPAAHFSLDKGKRKIGQVVKIRLPRVLSETSSLDRSGRFCRTLVIPSVQCGDQDQCQQGETVAKDPMHLLTRMKSLQNLQSSQIQSEPSGCQHVSHSKPLQAKRPSLWSSPLAMQLDCVSEGDLDDLTDQQISPQTAPIPEPNDRMENGLDGIKELQLQQPGSLASYLTHTCNFHIRDLPKLIIKPSTQEGMASAEEGKIVSEDERNSMEDGKTSTEDLRASEEKCFVVKGQFCEKSPEGLSLRRSSRKRKLTQRYSPDSPQQPTNISKVGPKDIEREIFPVIPHEQVVVLPKVMAQALPEHLIQSGTMIDLVCMTSTQDMSYSGEDEFEIEDDGHQGLNICEAMPFGPKDATGKRFGIVYKRRKVAGSRLLNCSGEKRTVYRTRLQTAKLQGYSHSSLS